MANYQTLKSAIQAVVKTNGNNEITGASLQQMLIAMITSLGAHYDFVDVATPYTNPGTPDQNVMYFASTAGTYTNFGGIVVDEGEFCALCWNGSWIKKTTGVATSEQLVTLDNKINSLSLGKFYGFIDDVAELPTGDEPGYAYVGSASPFEIYNFVNGIWTNSGSVYEPPVGNIEDIDTLNGKLQFANRPNTNGMGYKIVRSGSSFANQVTNKNTIYEIRYNFNLNGSFVSIPSGCILRFNGGKLLNGSLIFNDTRIEAANIQIFDSINLSGTIVGQFNVLWNGIVPNSNATPAFQAAINLVAGKNCCLFVPNGEYLLAPQSVPDYSATKLCHLFIPDSISIIGESQNGCVLKRVKADLSTPILSEYTGHLSLWGSVIASKMLTNDNGQISFENITIDGNLNWRHIDFEDLIDGDKLFESIGTNHITNFNFRNVTAKNSANEGFYATTYTKIGTKVRFYDCSFENIGGGATNIGGDDFMSIGCTYNGCWAEHSWSGNIGDGRSIFRNCIFTNRRSTFISSDYQGTVTEEKKKGKILIVQDCVFIVDNAFYTAYMAGTTRVNAGVYYGVCEYALIKGNTFIGLRSTDAQGGGCISIQSGATIPLNSEIRDNTTLNLRGVGSFVVGFNDSVIIKNNVISSTNTGQRYKYKLWENNTFNCDVLVSANVISTIQMWIPTRKRMIVKCIITNSSGETANVTAYMLSRNMSNMGSKTIQLANNSVEIINFVCTIDESSLFVDANTAIRNWRISSDKDVSVKWVGYDSFDIPNDAVFDIQTVSVYGRGTTTERPTLLSENVALYYDSTLKKMILWNGTSWVNMDGTALQINQ